MTLIRSTAKTFEAVANEARPKPQPGQPLTKQETLVLAEMNKGLSNKLIGVELGLSEHTVKFHVANVCAKLGVSTRIEATAKSFNDEIAKLRGEIARLDKEIVDLMEQRAW